MQHGCETLSLTLREERRLRVIENGILRRIFRLKNMRLHVEEFHNLHRLPVVVRVVQYGRLI